MKEVVLEILTFLPKMCEEDFFAFLDIWQGLALRQEEKDTVFILLYMYHNYYSFLLSLHLQVPVKCYKMCYHMETQALNTF